MMVELENESQLNYLLPGVYQTDIKSMFKQTVFGFTDDEIVVYNDHMPDSSNLGKYIYKIHAKLKYSDIIVVLVETLKGKKDLIYKKKIQFVAEDQTKSLILFVNKDGDKRMKGLKKLLKNKKLKIEKRTVVVDL